MADRIAVPDRRRADGSRARRAGQGAARRLGRALHRGRIPRRPLVRAGLRDRGRAAVPAGPGAARRHRPPQRDLRRAHVRRGPVRPHRSGSTAPARASAAAWDETDRAMHGAVPRGRRRVDRRDARRRRSSTRCSTCARAPRRRGRVGRGVRATWRGGSRGTGTRSCCARGSGSGRATTRPRPCCRRSRPTRRPSAAGALHGAIARRAPAPRAQGSNDWVVAGEPDRHRCAPARERPASARPAARRVDRAAPLGARVPGARVALPFSPGILLGTHRPPRLGRHERERRRSGPLRRASERGPHAPPSSRARGSRSRSIARRSSCGARTSPACSRCARRVTGRSSTRSRAGRCDAAARRRCRRADLRTARGPARERGSGPSLTLDAAQATSFEAFREAALGARVPRPERRLRRRRRHDRLRVHRPVPRARDG